MKIRKMAVAVIAANAVNGGFLTHHAVAQDGADGLEEIVITATRRETDVQDVPLAVTALTGEALQAQNIENLEDITAVVPNVLIAGGNGGTTSANFTMRGIPNVGTYLDGIWQVSNNGLLTRDFVELDRIEVLRGPQGTLYGRDSTGGSIHLHSKPPADSFGVTLSMQAGNLDRRDVMISADIPIGNDIRTKWTMGSYEQDGWVKSRITGINHGWQDSEVFRGDILWTPTDNLAFRLIHQEDDQVGKQARVQSRIDFNVAYFHGYQVGIAEAHDIASGGRFNPQFAVAGHPGGVLDEYESWSSSTVPNEQYLEQTTFHADWDITNVMHLKYMYGDVLVDASIYNDWGGSQYNFFVNYDTSKLDLKSHEFQLTGALLEGRMDYVLGYYSWEQESRNRGVEWAMADWQNTADMGNIKTLDYNDVLNSPACSRTPADVGWDHKWGDSWPVPCNAFNGFGWIGLFGNIVAGNHSDRLNGQAQEGDAIFGELTWYINPQWDVTVGYRDHTQDNVAQSVAPATLASYIASGVTEPRPRELNTTFVDRGQAVAGAMDTFTPTSFSADTYRLASSYDFNEDIMVYLGYSEGFNSGGVSLYEDSQGPVQIHYAPEVIENWELGLRADLFDRSLRANVTYFNTDWLGIQYLGTVIDRGTGEEATELVLQNSADGEAKGVELELTWLATDRLTLISNLGFLDTAFTNINAGVPITTSTEFARAPETTYMLAAQYEWDLFGGTLVGRLQSNYWDSYWRASTLELRQDFQGLRTESPAGDIWFHNARLTYTSQGGNYEITLWANNLTDEYNFNSGFMHGIWQFDFATVDRPREYGLQFKTFFN